MKTHVTTTQIKLSAVQKTVQPNDVRRLLPRGRTRRATGTAHVHPHARRATGATGALREERPTTKTTVRHASGTTTRPTTSARASSSPMRGPGLAQLSRRRTPRTQEESLVGSIACVASCPVRERRVMATTRASSVCTSVHMVRTHGRGWQSNDVRRLLPRTRRRTLPATGTAHVHPHARRATGATGALCEERASPKTTVCRASGTTTRRVTHEQARSAPMRGPDLAQLSRRRTPRTQEETLGGPNAYVASCPVRERRVMARTRCCAYEVTHGAYTCPRTATARRTTAAAADAKPDPARHGYSARPSSRAARYRRYRRAD